MGLRRGLRPPSQRCPARNPRRERHSAPPGGPPVSRSGPRPTDLTSRVGNHRPSRRVKAIPRTSRTYISMCSGSHGLASMRANATTSCAVVQWTMRQRLRGLGLGAAHGVRHRAHRPGQGVVVRSGGGNGDRPARPDPWQNYWHPQDRPPDPGLRARTGQRRHSGMGLAVLAPADEHALSRPARRCRPLSKRFVV